MAPKGERGILPRISPHVESGDKIYITYKVFEKKLHKNNNRRQIDKGEGIRSFKLIS